MSIASQNEQSIHQMRIAWLLPVMGAGGLAWQHILSEFSQIFPETIVFTGKWAGYLSCFKDSFKVKEVGQTTFIETGKARDGYGSGFSFASLSIVKELVQYKPQVIFTNAFSLWTLVTLMLKPLFRWKVIIIYEGGSPSVDYKSSAIRLYIRHQMVKLADALVSNSKAGKSYLTEILGASASRVFSRPFLIPSLEALLEFPNAAQEHVQTQPQSPIFLYVGQMVPRKGVSVLIDAFSQLAEKGYREYTLIMIGDGEQRLELEKSIEKKGLLKQVLWLGKLPYGALGAYFKMADVFIFPTNEDIWGMVLPEAMAFGKAVVCSRGAGSVEMVTHGQNGFIFSPQDAEELCQHICKFFTQPELIEQMGKQSASIMASHTPKDATQCFIDAVEFVY